MVCSIPPVDARVVAQSMTIKVKFLGMKRTRARLFLASCLLNVVAFVSPSPIDVSYD